MTKVIGFAGPAGVGKDTAGNLAMKYLAGFDKTAKRNAFAIPLKQMLLASGVCDGMVMDSNGETPLDKEAMIPGLGFSYRRLAQTLGTEWGRGLDPDFWVKLADKRLDGWPYDFMVITDVRFDNEAIFTRRNGVLIHVEGPSRVELKENSGHASEDGIAVDMDEGDLIVKNTGSIDDLTRQVGMAITLSGLVDL